MENFTPKVSGTDLGFLIEETPASTPVPQASSTTYRCNYNSATPDEHVDSEPVHQNVLLEDAITGLESFANKIRNARSQFFKQQNNLLLGRSNGSMSSKEKNIYSEIDFGNVESETDSSLGILKVDDLRGLSDDVMDGVDNVLFEEDSCNKIKCNTVTELSDLAVDMRHRLQKELAQRAIDRFSMSSERSNIQNINECYNSSNNLFSSSIVQADMDVKVNQSVPFKSDLYEEQICEKLVKTGDFNKVKTFQQETCDNPFYDSKFDGEAARNMSIIMNDFENEDFISGDKCEEMLAADESIWTKENMLPTVGAVPSMCSKLDFSGIVGNAEISLSSVDASQYGLKRKISVGEFFRLKSNKFGDLASKTSNSCSKIQDKSPEKSHKLTPLSERKLYENNNKDKSLSSEFCKDEGKARQKSLPISVKGKSLQYLSEQELSCRDSLSLSCIADILANVDTNASPRTVVSNILRQSGLCKSKRTLPLNEINSSKSLLSSSVSDVYSRKEIQKGESGVNNTDASTKLQVGNLNITKYDENTGKSHRNTEVPYVVTEMSLSRNNEDQVNVCKNQVMVNDESVFSKSSNLRSNLSYDGDGSESNNSAVSEESDGWTYSMPNISKGIGARFCSSKLVMDANNETTQTLNVNERNKNQTITLEDTVASGDLSVLNFDSLVETKNSDESLLSLTKELFSMPKKSVDCSALVPTLKKKCPEIWPQTDSNNKQEQRSQPEWNSSIHFKDIQQTLSDDVTGQRLCAESMNSSTITGLLDNSWVVLTTPIPAPFVCVGVPFEVLLPVHNVTDRWLLCGIELNEVKLVEDNVDKDFQVALVQPPSKRVLMDPNNQKEAKVKVVPLCEGKIHILLKINLEDVVTKSKQIENCDIFITGEEPQIVITKMCDTSDISLDFGILPEECSKEINLKFRNRGFANVPLKLTTINQDQYKFSTFILLDPEKQNIEDVAESNVTTELMFLLKGSDEMNVTVMCAAPPMRILTKNKGVLKFSGELSVELDGIMLLKLESLKLTGGVGTTSFGILTTSIPMQLVIKEPGKTDTCNLPLRNNGKVPLNLSLELLSCDEDFTSMTVEPEHIEIMPGDQVEPTITFTASKLLKEPVHKVLQITLQPNGPQYSIDVFGRMTSASIENSKKYSRQLFEKVEDSIKEKSYESQFKGHSKMPLCQSSSDNSSVKSVSSNGLKTSVISGSVNDRLYTKSRNHSSGSSSSGEKLNVRTTHRQLIWGSVAVGKTSTKSFTIRNNDHIKLPVYLYVEDKCNAYKLLDRSDHTTRENSIIIDPKGDHCFQVNFKPQKIGAVYGKLVFIIQGVHLIIPMYGFGGHARLVAKGVPRDGGGRMWLMLYQNPQKNEWETSFALKNLGDLKAFIKIKPICKGFQNVSTLSLLIQPPELVMHQGETKEIKVKYKPQSQELKLLMSKSMQDVIEVAALSLVSGDEPTRLRLRRIHEKNGEIARKKGSTTFLAQNTDLDLAPLCAKFPGEREGATPDIMQLKDPQDSALELYNAGVNHQEIILLLENASDGHGVNASRAFQSMYQYIVDLSMTRHDDLDQDILSDEFWQISPSTITLKPPSQSSATVVIQTISEQKSPFEVVCSEHPPGFTLNVTPNAGFISTHGMELLVSCSPTDKLLVNHSSSWKGVLKVYIENDFKELTVFFQYPTANKKETQCKKVTHKVDDNVGIHNSTGFSTPSTNISFTSGSQNKVTSTALKHRVLSDTARKKFTTARSLKKMFVHEYKSFSPPNSHGQKHVPKYNFSKPIDSDEASNFNVQLAQKTNSGNAKLHR